MQTPTVTSATRRQAPAWASWLFRCITHLIEDAGGGPRLVKMAWAINFHKIFTALIILVMMGVLDNRSTFAWVYLALHGTYGYCWLIKDASFRDANFERKITFGGIFFLYGGLIAWYWLLPYFALTREVPPSGPVLAGCIAAYIIGIALLMAGDLQKNLVLQMKKGLITNGVFAYTRNPNYVGEILIYGAFAALAGHWLAWVIVSWLWLGVFLPRMLIKDASISRHPGWDAYARRSGMLLPWALLGLKEKS